MDAASAFGSYLLPFGYGMAFVLFGVVGFQSAIRLFGFTLCVVLGLSVPGSSVAQAQSVRYFLEQSAANFPATNTLNETWNERWNAFGYNGYQITSRVSYCNGIAHPSQSALVSCLNATGLTAAAGKNTWSYKRDGASSGTSGVTVTIKVSGAAYVSNGNQVYQQLLASYSGAVNQTTDNFGNTPRLGYIRTTTDPLPNDCLETDGKPIRKYWTCNKTRNPVGTTLILDKESPLCQYKVTGHDENISRVNEATWGTPGQNQNTATNAWCLIETTGVIVPTVNAEQVLANDIAAAKKAFHDAWNSLPPIEFGADTSPTVAGDPPAAFTPSPKTSTTGYAPSPGTVTVDKDVNDCNGPTNKFHPGNYFSDGSCSKDFQRDHPGEQVKADGSQAWCWKGPLPGASCTKDELTAHDPATNQNVPLPEWQRRNPNVVPSLPAPYCASCNGGAGSSPTITNTNPDGSTKTPVAGDKNGDGKKDGDDGYTGGSLWDKGSKKGIGDVLSSRYTELKATPFASAIQAFTPTGTASTGDKCWRLPDLPPIMVGQSMCIPSYLLDIIRVMNLFATVMYIRFLLFGA